LSITYVIQLKYCCTALLSLLLEDIIDSAQSIYIFHKIYSLVKLVIHDQLNKFVYLVTSFMERNKTLLKLFVHNWQTWRYLKYILYYWKFVMILKSSLSSALIRHLNHVAWILLYWQVTTCAWRPIISLNLLTKNWLRYILELIY
jgi:hypothetical protein